MLNRQTQIETHKKDAEEKLSVRLERLRSQGKNETQIAKDTQVKQIKALIRKAKHQMMGIAKMKNLIKEKSTAKDQKAAQAKAPAQDQKKAVKSTSPKKPKKKKPTAEEE